jgi:small subunit ribosomal protein S16
MVVIRLTRVGKKNSPAYRVVVAEKRRAVKRKFIEIIGHYNPTQKPKEIVIDKDRALFWVNKGAQPSDTVRNLMADLDIIPKKDKVNIKYARDKKKKESAEVKVEDTKTEPTADAKSEEVADGDKTETPDAPKTEAESKSDEVSAESEEKSETEKLASNPEESAGNSKSEEKESDKSKSSEINETKPDDAKKPKKKAK